MLRAQMPVEKGNHAIESGALEKVMKSLTQQFKPEATYFYPENGKRAFLMVFDMKDASQMPSLAERLFMELGAEVSLTPVMNPEDLKKGLEAVMAAKATA
jgi:hypothetical protein